MQIDIIIVYIFQLNMSKSRNKMSKSLTHYRKLDVELHPVFDTLFRLSRICKKTHALIIFDNKFDYFGNFKILNKKVNFLREKYFI